MENQVYKADYMVHNLSPNGRSIVFDGVRTTGSDARCFEPRRKPVAEVSASDIIPGSSSISELLRESIGIINLFGISYSDNQLGPRLKIVETEKKKKPLIRIYTTRPLHLYIITTVIHTWWNRFYQTADVLSAG